MNRTPLFATLLLLGACSKEPECRPVEGAANELCLPTNARANQPLTIEARDMCGGCGSPAYTSCEVTVSGNSLTVTLSGEQCEVPDGVACSLACRITDLTCPVPPLPPGTYTVVGQPGTLTVTASATTTRCDLGAP